MKLKIYKNNIIYTYTEPQLQYNAILILKKMMKNYVNHN